MIASILAVDNNWCIWKNNSLCWHLKQDLKFFSEKTKDSVVIMWKNTYYSLPESFRPLPGRINIVISRTEKFCWKNLYSTSSISEAVKLAYRFNKPIFFIGWKIIYEQSLDYVDTIYMTRVLWDFDCDICLNKSFFNTINKNFIISYESEVLQENNIKFKFIEFKLIT